MKKSPKYFQEGLIEININLIRQLHQNIQNDV